MQAIDTCLAWTAYTLPGLHSAHTAGTCAFSNALIAFARYEGTPWLQVTMPDYFRMKITPSGPLTPPTLLWATVRRARPGYATVGFPLDALTLLAGSGVHQH
jgi:hypothetical protein